MGSVDKTILRWVKIIAWYEIIKGTIGLLIFIVYLYSLVMDYEAMTADIGGIFTLLTLLFSFPCGLMFFGGIGILKLNPTARRFIIIANSAFWFVISSFILFLFLAGNTEYWPAQLFFEGIVVLLSFPAIIVLKTARIKELFKTGLYENQSQLAQ